MDSVTPGKTRLTEKSPGEKNGTDSRAKALSAPVIAPGTCQRCGGIGWYTRPRRPGEQVDPKFANSAGVLTRCEVCGDTHWQEWHLKHLSMLSGDDLDITFTGYWNHVHGPEPLQKARRGLQCNGFLIYTGVYGSGKSQMLKAIVNEARAAGRLGVYTTLPNLLDKLRQSVRGESPAEMEGLWDNLRNCSVLALDEIDKAYETPWAAERLQLLAESRYIDWRERLTVWALNDWSKVPGYLKSRLLDTQRSTTVAMQQRDLRRQVQP
jgi:hypothetical protein